MKHKIRSGIAAKAVMLFMAFTVFCGGVLPVRAASPGSVVINEIAWAGTEDNSNDEWIELYNTTDQIVDLTGWTINDDSGSSIYALSGSIAAHGYYLAEDREEAVNPNTANAVINVSLANTGDSLVLYDAASVLIDAVNSSGGAWFFGNATTKATMERKDPLLSGDLPGNWATYAGSGGPATGALGSLIMGTPGALNSVSTPPATTQKVTLELSSAAPQVGGVLNVTAKASDVSNLFNYGFEIVYDPAVLSFVSAAKGSFLSESEQVETSFNAGLEDAVAGKLLVAEARLLSNKTGVSGSGTLFTMQFNVTGFAGAPSSFSFGTGSFAADTTGDLTVQFNGASFTPQNAQADPVTNLQAAAGTARYTIKLTWTAPAGGADKYKIFRKDAHGAWKSLGEVTAVEFIDSDAVTGGGKIIPLSDYGYEVKSVKGTVESAAVEVLGKETRGLKGDNNRTDRVDGRDLEKLARQFALTDADSGFDALADTTYDGQVNGSDLIDLGMNFAKVYKP